MEKHKENYPTLGKKLKEHPKGVGIYTGIMAGIALIGIAYVIVFKGMNTDINWYYYGVFIALNIILEGYSDYHTYKNKSVITYSPLSYMSLLNIIVFKNIYLVIPTIMICIIAVALFGARRYHSIVFNIANTIISLIPTYILIIENQEKMAGGGIDYQIYIIAIGSVGSFMLLNTINLTIIITLATKGKITKVAKMNFEKRKMIGMFVFLVTFESIAMIAQEAFIALAILSGIIIVEVVEMQKKEQKIREKQKYQLDKMGNPLFVIEGYLEKTKEEMEKGKEKEKEIKENIERIEEKVKEMREIIEKK